MAAQHQALMFYLITLLMWLLLDTFSSGVLLFLWIIHSSTAA